MSEDYGRSGVRKRQLTYVEQIKETTLSNLSRAQDGRGPRFIPEDDKTILKGHFCCDRFLNAIELHSSDTVEMENYTVQALLKPALTVCVLLEGRLESSFDDTEFVLDASDGPKGFVWAYGKSVRWQRKIQSGMRIRKINISAEANWLLEQMGAADGLDGKVATLFEDPFRIHEWELSSRVISLTNQVIMQEQSSALLHYIRRESRALEILGEALESYGTRISPAATPEKSHRYLTRAELIRDYIEHQDMTQLKLSTLARELGFSVSNMQSCFKRAFGMTIMDYIRERRLITAREALEREGVSIAEAAYVAGYNSPSNFSTAFKRQFGLSPSEIPFD